MIERRHRRRSWRTRSALAPRLYEPAQAVEYAPDNPGRLGTCAVRINLRVPRSLVLELALSKV